MSPNITKGKRKKQGINVEQLDIQIILPPEDELSKDSLFLLWRIGQLEIQLLDKEDVLYIYKIKRKRGPKRKRKEKKHKNMENKKQRRKKLEIIHTTKSPIHRHIFK